MLSDKAKSELPARKESVVVAAYLFGFPGKDTPGEFVSDMGEVGLGQVTAEVAPGQNASFEKVEINPKTVRLIDNHGPQLLINVVSGRKSSENNLLNCGIYEGPLKTVEGTSISIRCKLIDE